MSSTIDQWAETINGVRFYVKLVEDCDCSPIGEDWASAKDIELWKGDAWRYIGVIVAVDIDGIEPDWADASLWGVQYGDGDGWSVGRKELLEHPVKELADEAMIELGNIGYRVADAVRGRDAAMSAWAASKNAEPSS